MKKSILLLILSVSLFAEMVEITKGVNVRDSKEFNNSAVVGTASEGQKFEVLEVYASFYKVEVISNSAKVGAVAWIWSGIVELDGKGNATVTGQGGTLRSAPKKGKDTENGFVKAGAILKIIDKLVIRYKINGTDSTTFKSGWVSAEACKLIK